ncbi:MAG: DUF5686 and carboxypeptidase regulatory-like domain-containing protein [Bacteroidales bacterium]
MNLRIGLGLIFFLLSFCSGAQVLKGRITDKAGQPVAYATVYIRELRQGTTSNTKGNYEIRLPAGKYMVLYQSLSYEPVFTGIELRNDTVVRNVILTEQYYEVPEVKISATGEDPAYPIMRRVIGLAPFYLNYIKSYKADVYLKGDLHIKRIPKIIQRSIKAEARRNSDDRSISSNQIKEGDFYIMESFNEITFTAPDKYVQRVISSKSTFPEQGNDISPMDYIQASFYQPVIADIAVSPLSPSAFSYYRFKYLGASRQAGYTVDKIEVTPKRKSQQVFSGTIFIIDGLWCLQSVDLENENLIGTIRVKQLFVPVQDDIWMPVSHNFEVNIGIMGFRADVTYGSSVKYLEVTPNLALKKPDPLTGSYSAGYAVTDTGMTKTKKQIETILQKEDLSNRDMVRLSNLMKKESAETVPDSIKKNLEIRETTTRIVEKDAGKKDSAWWADIRPIPLSEVELKSIKTSDSLRSATLKIKRSPADTIGTGGKRSKSRAGRVVRDVASGHTWSDTTGFRFSFGGLLNLKSLSFNTVDGFVYGTDFRLSKNFDHGSLGIYPDIRYAFSRQSLMWRTNVNYSAGGKHQGQVFLRTGMTSRDFNNAGGINPLLNSVYSLFLKRNYLKLYGSDYITAGYARELFNGLRAEVSAGYENRKILQNTTYYSFIRSSREYTDNVPVNKFIQGDVFLIDSLRSQHHFEFLARIKYTPYQRYRIHDGNRIPAGSDWPVFTFTWKHGINHIPGNPRMDTHFDMLGLEVEQRRELGAFREFRWQVRTGGFADNRNIEFFDYFHFNTQPTLLLLNDYQNAFMLPAFYSLGTPELFGEAHFKYKTPYLLLKYLPGLSNTLIRENLSLSFLGSRYSPVYTELGYSMSEIFLIGEAGIYAGFDGLKYRSAGFKIVFRFN